MYLPPAFSETRLDVLHEVMRQHSFASIVVNGADGPVASHVPVVLISQRGKFGCLQMHLARPNEQVRMLADGASVLAMFQGPHAYISPRWYKAAVAVPTWNYLAVHAYGKARLLNDAELGEHLGTLASHYEPPAPLGWSPGRMPAEVLEKMKRNIIGFEMEILRIEGKWKLSQNRSQDDVSGAIAGLMERGDAEEMKVAELMQAAMGAKTVR